jgi:hypothetical protein
MAAAIRVGMTALAITTVTRNEYCSRVTMPWLRPQSAEMVPKVSLDQIGKTRTSACPGPGEG